MTAADEKIIRIFQPPFNIVKFLLYLSEENISYSNDHENDYYDRCIKILY